MLNLSVEHLLCVLRVTPLPPLLAEILLLPQHLCSECEETESQRTQLVQTELKIVFFLVAPGLRCCVRAFSSCSEQRLLFIVMKMLVVVASRVAWSLGFRSCSV